MGTDRELKSMGDIALNAEDAEKVKLTKPSGSDSFNELLLSVQNAAKEIEKASEKLQPLADGSAMVRHVGISAELALLSLQAALISLQKCLPGITIKKEEE